MNNRYAQLLICLLSVFQTHPNKLFAQSQIIKISDTLDTITLVFGGDLMGHGPQIQAAKIDSNNTYDYKPGFRYLQGFIQNADFAVANLEVTLAGPPYKGYPQFSSPDEYALNMKQLGFDLLVTANNHSQDGGKRGLLRTINTLNNIKIHHTGTFSDTQEFISNYPYITEINGLKIAILNYTYGTNGLTVTPPTMVNIIDTLYIRNAIEKARKMGASIVIPVMHWGNEYQRQESPQQRELAHFLADAGCDAIIGMHPHVVQPIKTITSKNGKSVPVAYSLGNFVSNQRERFKDGGILARIKILHQGSQTRLIQIDYKPFWVHKLLPHEVYGPFEKRGYYLIPSDKTTLLGESYKKEASQFFEDTRELLKGLTEWK